MIPYLEFSLGQAFVLVLVHIMRILVVKKKRGVTLGWHQLQVGLLGTWWLRE